MEPERVDAADPDTDDGRVERLDWGPPRDPGRQRRLLIGAVLAVTLVVAGGVAVRQADRGDASESPGSGPSTAPTASRSRPPAATASAPQTRTWRTAPFLAELDLDLFARGNGRFYRIETKRRQVTETSVPAQSSGSGPMTLLVGPEQVLVRDWGTPAWGYVVRDRGPVGVLPEAVASAGQVLAGPPGRIWLVSAPSDEPLVTLTDFAGRPARAESGPSTFRGVDNLSEDRRGGLLVTAAGSIYELTARGPRRLARGTAVAIGARHVLVSDCSVTLRCSRHLVTRATGERRRVGPTTVSDYADGSLSADGRYAATWSWSRRGGQILSVLDLRTNTTLTRVEEDIGGGSYQSLVWLPDNRLVGLRDGRIFLFDPAAGRTTTPELGLVGVDQIALRSGAP